MNTTTDNAKQLRKTLVALASVALLIAASPVYSATASEGNTVACQSGFCGG
jgi:starvation-inducible outer membrane lipoprotein